MKNDRKWNWKRMFGLLSVDVDWESILSLIKMKRNIKASKFYL